MATSTTEFDRWNTSMKTTWPLQVFNKYNAELNKMLWANGAASRKAYCTLRNDQARWTDTASKHLDFRVAQGTEVFSTLKEWSDSYNYFDLWVRLNALLAMSSNLETYISTTATLALESDPGVLFGSSRLFDGANILKNDGRKNIYHDDVIESLTKGVWHKRMSSYKEIFGAVPVGFDYYIGALEKVRTIRNKVGHAFGREITASRNHEVKSINRMTSLSKVTLREYQNVIYHAVKSIDSHLLNSHIGEYQKIFFFHQMQTQLAANMSVQAKAAQLKQELGKYGDASGKLFCQGLVQYYDAL